MSIPKEIREILQKLEEENFESFIVGGCVRDLLMGRQPKDWDITSNAKPEEIQKIFPDSFYENEFGTVGVKIENQVVEITTYRTESKYTDKRHPDDIKFADKIEDDLKRRDFTINALAMDGKKRVVDLFDGKGAIASKTIQAVGNPEERFNEDALRMMRAVRLATILEFDIEKQTLEAIEKNHSMMRIISKERIRDEFIKIIEAPSAKRGMDLLRQSGLLQHTVPELLEGVGVEQNLHHIYTIWEHNIRALDYACSKNYSTEVRLASLLHDIGKPKTKRGGGRNCTFYGHEVVGARIAGQILDRLKFPKKQTDKIVKLVRWHLFYYNIGEVTESSVRRLVANIGKEDVEDLIKVREADRIGSGTPKAVPYKLRHLKFMIDKVARDPLSPKMLRVNGNDIMALLEIEPSPKIGMLVAALMNEVLDDPDKNEKKYLEKRVAELDRLTEKELGELGKRGKQKVAKEEEKEIEKIKARHYVS